MKNAQPKISWAKDLSHLTKEQFIDMHKEAYPGVDLAKVYDDKVGKKEEEKPTKR